MYKNIFFALCSLTPIFCTIGSLAYGGLFSSSGGDFDAQWSPRTPYQYASSFHSLLAKESPTLLTTANISRDCLNGISSHMKAGEPFLSQALIRNTIAIDYIPNPEVSDREFYHYTSSNEALQNATPQGMDYNFLFLRSLKDASSWYLYMAADQSSSSSFGSRRIHITLYPGIRILLSREGYYGHGEQAAQIQSAVETELIQKYPELSSCRNVGASTDIRNHSILMRLAIESSGIGAIAYFGMNNQFPHGICNQCQGSQWFQLVGPWAIESIDTETD